MIALARGAATGARWQCDGDRSAMRLARGRTVQVQRGSVDLDPHIFPARFPTELLTTGWERAGSDAWRLAKNA